MLIDDFNNLSLGLSVEETLTEINQNTLNPLTLEDVYIFKVKLCDSSIDRDYDKLTDNFLKEFTEKSQSLVGLYNHDWGQVEKQQIRLFKALYIDDTDNPYVLGYAYTLSKNIELIENISSGLLKHCSISFNSDDGVCSICGSKIINGLCEQGHEVGNYYDESLCYRIIDHCLDSLEFSLVSVPANKNASIIKNFTGGKKVMKKSKFNFLRFLSTKSYTEEDRQTILKAVDGTDETDEEITEEEIKSLINENSVLKATNDALNVELDEVKEELEKLKIELEEKNKEPEVVENVEKQIESDEDEKPEEKEVKTTSKGLKATVINPTLSKGSVVKKTATKSNYKGICANISLM